MLFTRCVAGAWLFAAMLAVACGGESTKREVPTDPGALDETGQAGQAGSGPDRPVLSELPVDFRSQCPAAGCTLKLQTPDISGVWSYCGSHQLPAFDPSTFDFGAACAGAIKEYPVLPRPDSEDNVYFADHGLEYTWGENSSYCTIESLFLTSKSELVIPDCSRGVSEVTGLYFDHAGPLLRNGPDGSVYRYIAVSSAATASVSPVLLATADTPSLAAACIAEPSTHFDRRCATDGVTFPFGPSGVGTPPDDRLARTWLLCYNAISDSDRDIVSACGSALEEDIGQTLSLQRRRHARRVRRRRRSPGLSRSDPRRDGDRAQLLLLPHRAEHERGRLEFGDRTRDGRDDTVRASDHRRQRLPHLVRFHPASSGCRRTARSRPRPLRGRGSTRVRIRGSRVVFRRSQQAASTGGRPTLSAGARISGARGYSRRSSALHRRSPRVPCSRG